jgi:hypothetical protein
MKIYDAFLVWRFVMFLDKGEVVLYFLKESESVFGVGAFE